MRSDLLDALASISWAESNFLTFQTKLKNWLDGNISLVIKELGPETPNNIIVAIQNEPLPLEFNAEFGAYINALRSALDMLAVALAARYGFGPEDVYFPIAKSKVSFYSGKTKSRQYLEKLPSGVKNIFETLEPYDGGNKDLWMLHKLDITRKHHRLLKVSPQPASFSIRANLVQGDLTPINSPTGYLSVDDETVLFLIKKSVKDPKCQFSAEIFIDEPEFKFRAPVLLALNNWAKMVRGVVSQFDF